MTYGNSNQNKNSNGNEPKMPVAWTVAIIVICFIGLIGMYKDISGALNKKEKCFKTGCDNEALDGDMYCYKHSSSYKYKYSSSSSSSSKSTSSSSKKYETTTQSASSTAYSSKKRKNHYSEKTVDPSDHDIDMYYEDYRDEFEDEDDAWDDFEDNEEYWDEY